MAVEVQRDPDLAVAEPLTRHFGMDAARKQMRGVGMSQIMKANARQGTIASDEADPLLAKAMRAVTASRPPA